MNMDCCPENMACDHAAFLEDALAVVGHLREAGEGVLSFDDVRRQLQKGLPVGVRIGWFGGGGHFVMIVGYRVSETGQAMVRVADPKYTGGRISYDALVHAYEDQGEWTHTYLVRP
jgi:hypothetical protein